MPTETAPSPVNAPDTVPLFDVRLTDADLEAVAQTLRSGWLSMGPRTQEFERAFAAQLGVAHAVALSSATAALHLAYLTAGVGPGDEVIVPSYTFVATAAAVRYCGATPVFADILGAHDLSIDPDAVRRCLSPRTKAVACVHFAGYPAQVALLAQLCEEHGIALIEDAAHAPSGAVDGRKLGSWGRAAAFSLFSNKILSVGEGGLLVTSDDAVAEKARSLRSHAMSTSTWERHASGSGAYEVDDVGFNYRIDEPRSALALSRLERLDQDIASHRRLTRAYRERLREHPGLTLPFSDQSLEGSCCYLMPVLLSKAARREQVREALRERHGVHTGIHYAPVHTFAAYRQGEGGVGLPVTEQVAAGELTLPLFAHMSDSQLDRVVSAIEAEVRA